MAGASHPRLLCRQGMFRLDFSPARSGAISFELSDYQRSLNESRLAFRITSIFQFAAEGTGPWITG